MKHKAFAFILLYFCFTVLETTNSYGQCLQLIEIPSTSGDEEIIERIYVFTCNTNWTIPGIATDEEPLDEAEILIVAGGGGGGRGTSAGGGGAGGLIYIPSELLPSGSVVSVIVGTGGNGSTATNQKGGDGQNSGFLTYTAIGGGGGGSNNNTVRDGNLGGSGGGGARQGSNGSGGTGSGGQGNIGANGSSQGANLRGGGGGGAGGAGTTGQGSKAGNGGDGVSSNISNSNIFYAGGGGGTSNNSGADRQGDGGSGVGGNGSGSGAGGNGSTPGSAGGAGSTQGGNGANGIVIVKQAFKVLPVEFQSYEVNFRQEEKVIEIKWATAKEWENSHFDVERSFQNINNWVTVGKVEGMGFSDQPVHYSFQDNKLPLTGGIVYYRLKQVDFSENEDYSKVLSIKIPALQFTQGVWRAYPNPTDGESLRIGLLDRNEFEGEAITFRIIHPMIQTAPISVKNESEMNEMLSQLIGRVPRGVFVVEIQWGQKVEHIKVLRR